VKGLVIAQCVFGLWRIFDRSADKGRGAQSSMMEIMKNSFLRFLVIFCFLAKFSWGQPAGIADPLKMLAYYQLKLEMDPDNLAREVNDPQQNEMFMRRMDMLESYFKARDAKWESDKAKAHKREELEMLKVTAEQIHDAKITFIKIKSKAQRLRGKAMTDEYIETVEKIGTKPAKHH
jgi:hypothetical protein